MDQYFRVIGERPTPPVERRPLIGAVARQRAAAIRDHVHRMSKRLIAVHAQTRAGKCWPQARWTELGSLLREECELVLLGLRGQALSQDSAYLSAPQGWEKQVAILAHADAFVGIDSCFSHVADAFNLPGVVLYGDAAQAAFWRPKGPALQALIARDGRLESLAARDVAERLRSRAEAWLTA
jgi:ADP-heptose:LPS heptosyltransferase